ncbi:MAG: DNA recombination protein RmuC [Erysipelotrichaceae bacterium]|nr:DNA recombination protein RmuC [Erysipelotrichaceae bacterium]
METMILILGGLIAAMLMILIVLTMVNKSSSEAAVRSLMMDSERAKRRELDELKDQFQDDMNELKDRLNHDLVLFQNSLALTVRKDLDVLNESTARRLNRIELSVSDSLMKGFDRTAQSFTAVSEQMARIDETQKNLKALSENIISLEEILTDKKSRGTFGEIELYSLIEHVFGLDGQRYRKQVKLSNGFIADCVMFAPEPLGNLVIDSKFPLENYSRLIKAGANTDEYRKAASEFRKDVRNHISVIADKYLIAGETAEFACMFIPSESVFAEIVAHFDDLVQFSYQKKVYLVSPTTMMAYLNAIKAFYLNQERSEKVVEIQHEYAKLSKEFERFVQRWQILVKDFDRIQMDMHNLDITADKIIRRFQQIEAVDLSHSSEEKSL